MSETSIIIPSSAEKGSLGISHLYRYWSIARAKRNGSVPVDAYLEDWNLDNAMLNTLGLGLEQTIVFLFQEDPGFAEFENWILSRNNGELDSEKINLFNQLVAGQNPVKNHQVEKVLTTEQVASWNENGYLILPAVISPEDCENTIKLICDHIGINRSDPSTWYLPHPDKQGIMVQLFQHPVLEKNRQNVFVRKVYEELWGRTDLIVSTDRVGFNPPETDLWSFPGPRMHWDVSLKQPIPFGLQGILYLADTEHNQGAFSLVPGFHNKIESWINNLPPGAHPRKQDIEALGVKPIAANAGDFIVWHHALPHGSSANKSDKPRFVQYFNWMPPDLEVQLDWI